MHRTHVTLKNGHTLTIVRTTYDKGAVPRDYFGVSERNELGTFIGMAFGSFDRCKCEAWVTRAQARGYGYRETVGGRAPSSAPITAGGES